MAKATELEALQRGIQELQQIVGAMRSLAAARAQEANTARLGLARYEASFRSALSRIAPWAVTTRASAREAGERPPAAPGAANAPSSRRFVLLLGVEHGFVAGHAERIVRAAERELASPNSALGIAGSSTAERLSERGLRFRFVGPLPSSLRALPASVEALVRVLDAMLREQTERTDEAESLPECDLVYARLDVGQELAMVRERLIPLEVPTPFELADDEPPILHVAPEELLHELARELIAAQVAHGLLEALAAENAARLAAMDAAHRRVERRLDELGRELQRMRQEEVTSELADLLAGVEVASGHR